MLILARILEPLLGDDGCHRNDTDHAIPCQRSRELLLSRRRRLAFPQGSTFVVSIGSLVSSGAAGKSAFSAEYANRGNVGAV